ncbi:MAG: hypothetical protein GY710_03435 [Desulfobacteraceae bacterium]|nr:hypothetical protein [Desulfobacteraceae bacterium]
MVDISRQIDLDVVHSAIIQGIKTKFKDIQTVSDYQDDCKRIKTPACLVELTECIASDSDPGTDQLSLITRWEANIIMGFRTESAKRAIRKLVTSMAAFIKLQNWGLPISCAEITGCFPDAFNPELDHYEVWRVEWSHTILFGQSIWTNDGAVPTEVPSISYLENQEKKHKPII